MGHLCAEGPPVTEPKANTEAHIPVGLRTEIRTPELEVQQLGILSSERVRS